jgi:hypothetical protein
MNLERLKEFRQSAYKAIGNAKDAVFELMDAVLLTRSVSCFAELSLSPVFRRQWSSIYEAIDDCRPQKQNLKKLYIKQMLQDGDKSILLAGDHTDWSRPEAVTLKDRTYEHGKQPIGGGKPVTLGQGYSTLAWIPEDQGSWALPLCHDRISSFETPLSRAAFQLRKVCQHLRGRPVSAWDSEYGNASFVNQTVDIPADKIMRLRPNYCLWREPPPYSGKGRPRKHGEKFKLNDETTWGSPQEILVLNDPTWGEVKIQRWEKMHFRRSPKVSMEVLRITRTGESLNQKERKPMWLVWIGEALPLLASIWHDYLRRFAVDHWNRLAKQRLHWTLPKLGTPEKCQRWSDLLPLMTWQLWLAREIVVDKPLPWQKACALGHLTPGRVAQSFGGVLAMIGTPARAPKPRGKSPGWTKGRKRAKRPCYPVVKKAFSRKKKNKSG